MLRPGAVINYSPVNDDTRERPEDLWVRFIESIKPKTKFSERKTRRQNLGFAYETLSSKE
jgi:hypothetical protein